MALFSVQAQSSRPHMCVPDGRAVCKYQVGAPWQCRAAGPIAAGFCVVRLRVCATPDQ
jgi:hypothetical protein